MNTDIAHSEIVALVAQVQRTYGFDQMHHLHAMAAELHPEIDEAELEAAVIAYCEAEDEIAQARHYEGKRWLVPS